MTTPATWTAIGTQLAVGGGLFYAVMKFFDTVGDRINEDTRLEIAVWLFDIRTANTVRNWQGTFGEVFDRTFGHKHLTVQCFARSSVASLAALLITATVWLLQEPQSAKKFLTYLIYHPFSLGGVLGGGSRDEARLVTSVAGIHGERAKTRDFLQLWLLSL